MTITITIPGTPVGKGRPRVTRHGTYTPEKTREYQQKVRDCYHAQCPGGFAGGVPILARITAYFPIPASYPKKKKAALEGAFHLKKPDADNIAKAILDALNGLAYPDDSAVQLRGVYKIYTNAAPRLELTLTDATEVLHDAL
jgi:Holliday junction resolvase RusA-like endonuclease